LQGPGKGSPHLLSFRSDRGRGCGCVFDFFVELYADDFACFFLEAAAVAFGAALKPADHLRINFPNP